MAWTFYFAWTTSGDTTFNAGHQVVDEQVTSFRITHEEGQFPLLEVTFLNPYVGPFSVGRSRWAWFSFSDGVTVTPLFFGRVVGSPVNLDNGGVQYQLVSKLLNWKDTKAALAETLKVAPYYDTLFLSDTAKTDPDVVLEGYSVDWHIDRFGGWSVSDVLVGEDGTVSLTNAEYDSINLESGQPPLKSVSYKTNATWKRVNAAGTAIPIVSQIVETYTGQGLIDDWPKSGTSIGGGWVAYESFAVDLSKISTAENVKAGYQYENRATSHNEGDLMNLSYSEEYPAFIYLNNDMGLITETSQPLGFGNSSYSYNATYYYAPKWKIQVYLAIAPEGNTSEFAEGLTVGMTAAIQPVEYEDGEGVETEANEISAGDATDLVGGDQSAFYDTDAGLVHVEYLLALCRARLKTRARAVTAKCSIPFIDGINLSCRKNGTITDARIPGGSCTGKVISYELYGDNGQFGCDVTLGVAIGTGESVDGATPGATTYVTSGTIVSTLGTTTGTITNPFPDVAYSPLQAGTAVVSPITAAEAVVSMGWGGPTLTQQATLVSQGIANMRINAGMYDPLGMDLLTAQAFEAQRLANARKTVEELLKDQGIFFMLELNSIKDIASARELTVTSELVLPAGINLQ